MPPLGTTLVGTALFAGDSPVSCAVSGAGSSAALAAGHVERVTECEGLGASTGSCEANLALAAPILGNGESVGDVVGAVPVRVDLSGVGGSLGFSECHLELRGIAQGGGTSGAKLGGHATYQGGVRVSFPEPEAYPQIHFSEVLQ